MSKRRPEPTSAVELIPTTRAAERLGRSVRTVVRLVETGQLAAVAKTPGLRGAYLFDPAEVERVAQERATTAEVTA